jgi:hypothetical protein
MKKLLLLLAFVGLMLTSCNQASQNEEKSKSDSKYAPSEQSAKSDSVSSAGGSVDMDQTADENQTKEEAGYAKNKSADKPQAQKGEEKKTDQPVIKQQPTTNIWDSAFVRRNSNRKLIKTANLVFSVDNVEKSTSKIEYIAQSYGGFILSSGITTNTNLVTTQRINSDSVMEIGTKSIENTITLRVPEFYLDSVLFQFSKLWNDLDERTLNAQDVTIDFLANEFRAKMYQKAAINISHAAQNNQRDLNDVVNAETQATSYLESTIQKKIENLTLQDRIDYATITLKLYQPDVLYKKKVVSYELTQYEPGFGSDFVDSLNVGWKIILGFVLFLAKGWSVLLISLGIFLVIYYFVKFLINRKKKRTITPEK